MRDDEDKPRFRRLLIMGGRRDTTAPTITSASSGSVDENVTLAFSLTANESVTWSIVGGADQAKFELSGSTLRWASNGTKDFEVPDDANTNNTYVVDVRATDGSSNTTDQTITITVLDVAEGGGSVTVNATGTKNYDVAATSRNYTGLTIAAGSNRALVVTICWDIAGGVVDPAITAMTWDGVAVTLIKSGHVAGNGQFAELWGLVNPATGNKTLAITWTNSAKVFIDAIAFDGVNQTGGATSFPGSVSGANATTLSVSSATGDKVVGAYTSGSALGTITGTTLFSDTSSGSNINTFANYDDGAATVVIGSSGTKENLVATNVKAA